MREWHSFKRMNMIWIINITAAVTLQSTLSGCAKMSFRTDISGLKYFGSWVFSYVYMFDILLVNNISECLAENRSTSSGGQQQFDTRFAAVRQKLGMSFFDWIWPRKDESTQSLGQC